jgi:pentatricopeptide repeat protein
MALRHKHLFHRFPLFQRAVFSSVSSTQRLSHEDIRTYENLIKEKLKKSEMVTSTDYHPLLQGYRLLTLPFEGKRLYNEMIQNYIEPDVGCYHELLGCYSLENQPIETEKMFREIWKKIPSDIKLLNILLHSYCHAGQPAHAEKIFHEFAKFAVQVTPTVISDGTLLSGYVKIGEPVEAIRIHQAYELRETVVIDD